MPSRQRMTDRSARQARARTWRAVRIAPYPVRAGGGPGHTDGLAEVPEPPAAPEPVQEQAGPDGPVPAVSAPVFSAVVRQEQPGPEGPIPAVAGPPVPVAGVPAVPVPLAPGVPVPWVPVPGVPVPWVPVELVPWARVCSSTMMLRCG